MATWIQVLSKRNEWPVPTKQWKTRGPVSFRDWGRGFFFVCGWVFWNRLEKSNRRLEDSDQQTNCHYRYCH
jgi:hypothetical protein